MTVMYIISTYLFTEKQNDDDRVCMLRIDQNLTMIHAVTIMTIDTV